MSVLCESYQFEDGQVVTRLPLVNMLMDHFACYQSVSGPMLFGSPRYELFWGLDIRGTMTVKGDSVG